jgi:hypothetical protein
MRSGFYGDFSVHAVTGLVYEAVSLGFLDERLNFNWQLHCVRHFPLLAMRGRLQIEMEWKRPRHDSNMRPTV